MADIVLYKDSPAILGNFAFDLQNNLRVNLASRRGRFRYRSTFKNGRYKADSVDKYRRGSKMYRATGELSRSISYKVLGTKIYLEFNEYGVMLDRGSDGYVLRQLDKDSLLADADVRYGDKVEKHIRRWIKNRGLKLRTRPKFGVGKKLPDTRNNRKRLEFLITRSLMNRGQNATFWFTAPYKALSGKLPEDLMFGMVKNIDEALDNTFKR